HAGAVDRPRHALHAHALRLGVVGDAVRADLAAVHAHHDHVGAVIVRAVRLGGDRDALHRSASSPTSAASAGVPVANSPTTAAPTTGCSPTSAASAISTSR